MQILWERGEGKHQAEPVFMDGKYVSGLDSRQQNSEYLNYKEISAHQREPKSK